MSPHPAIPTVPFRPPRWIRGPHAQTLAGKFLRPAGDHPLRRERLELPDGDFVDLDVGSGPGGEDPVVLVLHGLEGNARRGYMMNAYRALHLRGLHPVGMNLRGCSGEPNRLPRAYHSGETGDLRAVLEWIRLRFPGRRVGLLGFSLGGNVLLKLLGEAGAQPAESRQSPADAACAISVPFDLSAGADALGRGGVARLYTTYFLRSLRRKLETKRSLLESVLDLPAALEAPTIREFDERVTALLHGFAGAEDYYARSSSLGFLSRIRVPTLLLHSRDDPFLPLRATEAAAAVSNPALRRVFTDRGGHVGFVGRRRDAPRRFWAEEEAAAFLARQLS
jgi:predicted alpha/beta-fold hydrolase